MTNIFNREGGDSSWSVCVCVCGGGGGARKPSSQESSSFQIQRDSIPASGVWCSLKSTKLIKQYGLLKVNCRLLPSFFEAANEQKVKSILTAQNTPHNFRKGRPCPQRTASRCRKQNTATPGSTADSLKAGSFAVCPGSYKGENNKQKNASTTAVPTARLSVKAKLTLQASLSGTLPPLEEGRGKPVAGVWSKLRHSNHHEWLRLGRS